MTPVDSFAGLDTSVFWQSNQSGGWIHVLPPLENRRLLCLTPYAAVEWMLEREGARLTRIRSVTRSTGSAADAEPRRFAVEEPGEIRDGKAALWDGLVVHDPEGTLVNRLTVSGFAQLLGDVAPRIRSSGFIYLGIANRGSIKNWADLLRGRPSGTPSACLPSEIDALLRTLGWPSRDRHPMMLEGSRVSQVLGPSGYHSSKNRGKWQERVKEWLFGRVGAARLAPAYAHVSLGSQCEGTVLDRLQVEAGRISGTGDEQVLKEFLVLSGHKAVITLGSASDCRNDVVAVVTGDSLATERRTREAGTLQKLEQLGEGFENRFPRVLGHLDLARNQCFFISRIPGVTLDQKTAALEPVTESALDFLIRFHRRTASQTRIGAAELSAHVWPVVEAAMGRNAALRDRFSAWKPALRQALEGLQLPLVWLHGDYKVENVMYDEASCRVMGVIDWEHAMFPGLPLLDAIYLLVFNRHVHGAPLIDAIKDMILEGLTPAENARIERYCRQLLIPDAARAALEALFFAHHVGYRIHMDYDESSWRPYLPMLDRIAHRLGAHSQ